MQTNDMKFRLWNIVLVLALMLGSIVIAPAPVQAQEGQNRVMLPMVIGDPSSSINGLDYEIDGAEPFVTAANAYYPAGCDRYGRGDWVNFCWVGDTGYPKIELGPYVQAIQLILWCQGHNQGQYYTTFVDGDFGDKTRQAVMDFQLANGLSADGRVGSETWQALGNKLVYNGRQGSFFQYSIQGRSNRLCSSPGRFVFSYSGTGFLNDKWYYQTTVNIPNWIRLKQ